MSPDPASLNVDDIDRAMLEAALNDLPLNFFTGMIAAQGLAPADTAKRLVRLQDAGLISFWTGSHEPMKFKEDQLAKTLTMLQSDSDDGPECIDVPSVETTAQGQAFLPE
jgi:hypothetical protein